LKQRQLFDIVDGASRHAPQAIAIQVGEREIPYATLAADARALAARLQGLTARQSVLVFAGKSYETYVAILAISGAAKCYVPVSRKSPPHRNRLIIDQVDADTLFIDEAQLALVDQWDPDRRIGTVVTHADGAWRVTERRAAGGGAPARPASQDLSRMAYVLFTSGTTGRPKGIAIADDCVYRYVQAIREVIEFRADDRFSQLFDLTFDLSVHDMFVCWASGARLCVPGAIDELDVAGFVARKSVSVLFVVPSTIRNILKVEARARQDLRSLRLALFCGEALTTDAARQWVDVSPATSNYNLYGPTECTIAVSACAFDRSSLQELEARVVPIGRPIPGVSFDVRPVAGRDAAGGELVVGGGQVFEGYVSVDAPSLQDVFLADPGAGFAGRLYRTGDLSSRDADGVYHYHGRLDHQVKRHGYRIELQEVEAAVEMLVVGSTAYASLDRDTLALVVSSQSASVEEIRRLCKERLPTYMLPDRIDVVGEIFLNANGKKDRALAMLSIN
jgi:amino acid adenylation domain-containing protein